MHLVLHCKRLGNLALRAREDFAVGGVAFYDGLFGVSGAQGQDMGGNIEVSPPIRQPSNSMPAGAAGPAVPAQPPAPFGKIVFGSPDQAHRETRAFLLAQRVQPVLPIDTSWLRVGHVDEIMTTVPDGRGGFKLLVASAHAMTNLLERAAQVSRPYASNLHVGKYEPFVGAPTTPVAFLYAELEIEDLLRTPIANLPEPRLVREGDASAPAPTISVRDYNDRSEERRVGKECRSRWSPYH